MAYYELSFLCYLALLSSMNQKPVAFELKHFRCCQQRDTLILCRSCIETGYQICHFLCLVGWESPKFKTHGFPNPLDQGPMSPLGLPAL